MKILCSILACIVWFVSAPVWAATPTIVQYGSIPYDSGGGEVGTNAVYKYTLPMASLASNCLLIGIGAGGATAYAFADDKTNTWTAGPVITLLGQRVQIFYALNVAAGTRVVTVTSTNTTNGAPGVIHFAEIANVATVSALDTSGTASPVAGAGSIVGPTLTLANAGDLVYTFFSDVQVIEQTTLTGVTAAGGSTPNLIAKSLHTGQVSMYQVPIATGAITPSLTFTGTNADTFAVVSVALKSAAAGTLPTLSPRINGIQVDMLPSSTPAGNYTQVEFPSIGDNLIFAWDGERGANPCTLTSITDTALNTWVKNATFDTPANGTTHEFWSAKNTSPSNSNKFTLNLTNSTNLTFHTMFALIDTTGLDTTGPFDTSHTASGNQTVTGNLTTDTITPTNTNGIIFNTTMINAHTVSGASGAGFNAMMAVNSLMDGSDNTWWESNGIASFFNTNNAARTFVYTIQNNTAGVGTWDSLSAAYRAPSAAGSCSGLSLRGVGC